MPQLLGIRIENYRSLADVTLGQIGFKQGVPLPALMCFIGPNGSGKSSLLDALAFLADCLLEGVEDACDKPQRGGFSRLRTQGKKEPIRFSLYFRQHKNVSPITYTFEIGERRGVPVVLSERLLERRAGINRGRASVFLEVQSGNCSVWSGETVDGEESAQRVEIKLSDVGRLAITTLGQLSEHPRIVALRQYIEGWYLSYFVPEAARQLPTAGAQKHLDRTGSNLGNVVQYLQRSHPDRFKEILRRIQKRIPGIERIDCERSTDGRLLLKFNERGYVDPFFQYSMSDGTLKMFAYMLLLEDPEPPAFIGIEEPENGLYHKLLEQLAREFKTHSEDSKQRLQLLVTTHSPYFVDAMTPDQVWLLEKNEHGHTTATRTSDMPTISALQAEGIPLGSLWYSNHFDERWLK